MRLSTSPSPDRVLSRGISRDSVSRSECCPCDRSAACPTEVNPVAVDFFGRRLADPFSAQNFQFSLRRVYHRGPVDPSVARWNSSVGNCLADRDELLKPTSIPSAKLSCATFRWLTLLCLTGPLIFVYATFKF